MKVKQLGLLKRWPGASFGSTSVPPPAWHRRSNLEELISGGDGSHDFRDPRLIKPPYQNTGSSEGELEGIQGRKKKIKSCLPHLLQDKLKPQRNKS